MERGELSEVVQAFVEATGEICAQLLDAKVQQVAMRASENSLTRFDGAVAIVGFSGGLSGRLFLGVSASFLSALSLSMSGDESSSLEEQLLAMNEFGNLIAGHALTRVNNRFPEANVRPAPPSSFWGEQLVFFNFGMGG
ncbi:MAG: chemotaxis protein CheX, partial [Candidatus Caldatribacteriaceae bacterium]